MSARDIVITAIILFSLGLGFFIIHSVMSTTVDSMLGVGEINESEDIVTALEGIDKITAKFDYLILGVFIALTLGMIITSWFIAGNPIYTFIYFIVMIMAIVISALLANVWEEVSQASVFGTTITQFAITNNILMNLPIYIAVIGFIGVIVMFAKPRE